ncbi:hypothetical protein SLA2020_091030 [Shorea laevis]
MIVWLALYLWRRYSVEGVDCLVGSSVTNSKEQSQMTKHCQRIFSLTLPSFHPKLMMLAFIYLTKTLKACFSSPLYIKPPEDVRPVVNRSNSFLACHNPIFNGG